MCASAAPVPGGVLLELGFVLSLSALSDVRAVFEDEPLGSFASTAVTAAMTVSNIKTLCKAAGKFKYLRDTLIPQILLHEHRIDDGQRSVPIELDERFGDAMYSMCLAGAQLLSVRRAKTSNMSASIICKLCVECRKLAASSLTALHNVQRAVNASANTAGGGGDDMTVDLRDYLYLVEHIGYLSNAWCYYHYSVTVDDIAGMDDAAKVALKISALRYVKSNMKRLLDSSVVKLNVVQKEEQLQGSNDYVNGTARVIGEKDYDMVDKSLQDLEHENTVVYQVSTPNIEKLVLPVGKALVQPTKFEP